MMKMYCGFLLLLLVFTGSAYADDAAIIHVGGTIRPMDEHPSIRLVAEHVHARIYKKHSVFECIFFLRNDGPETIVDIGFPNHGDTEDFDLRFEYFESFVNGRKVEIQILEDPQKSPSIWYCKKVGFGEGELKAIRNVYKGRNSFNTIKDTWVAYVLHTGGSWAGTIGSASIVFSFEEFGTDKLWKIEPSGYEADENEIRWTLTDYEPEQQADVVEVWWNSSTPAEINSEIHRKAAQGDIEGVRHQLEQGIDINATRELSITPIVDAIFFGAGPEMVEFLIQNGAAVEIDPGRDMWWSPLSTALMVHERYRYPVTIQVVQILINNGAKVTRKEQSYINRATGDLKTLLEDHYQE
jgi:hypothetical protein